MATEAGTSVELNSGAGTGPTQEDKGTFDKVIQKSRLADKPLTEEVAWVGVRVRLTELVTNPSFAANSFAFSYAGPPAFKKILTLLTSSHISFGLII